MAYVSVEMKCANFDPCLLGEKGRLFESVDETYAGVELKAGLACIGIGSHRIRDCGVRSPCRRKLSQCRLLNLQLAKGSKVRHELFLLY